MEQEKKTTTAELAKELGVKRNKVFQAVKMCLQDKPHIAGEQYKLTAEDVEQVKAYLQKAMEYRRAYIQAKYRGHYVDKGEQPKKAGLYLCYRLWNGQIIPELIYWSGEYWVTGGAVEDRIITWHKLPRPPKIEQM